MFAVAVVYPTEASAPNSFDDVPHATIGAMAPLVQTPPLRDDDKGKCAMSDAIPLAVLVNELLFVPSTVPDEYRTTIANTSLESVGVHGFVNTNSLIVLFHVVSAGGVNVVSVGDPPPMSVPVGFPDESTVSSVIEYVGGVAARDP